LYGMGVGMRDVVFPGGGDYLLGMGETAAFSPGASGLSVSVWVAYESPGSWTVPEILVGLWDDMGWPDGCSWDIAAMDPSAGTVRVQVCGPGATYWFMWASVGLGDWVHLVLVRDPAAGRWNLYANGVAVDSAVFDSVAAAGRLGVGGHYGSAGSTMQGGQIDELAIWSRALTAAEVGTLYSSGYNGVVYPY
jgi:hypothetical protein